MILIRALSHIWYFLGHRQLKRDSFFKAIKPEGNLSEPYYNLHSDFFTENVSDYKRDVSDY